MGGWGCPHESKGLCGHLDDRPCEPGMKGCVLAGRFVFSDPEKNTARALREKADEDRRRKLSRP
ncbi:hypothetical protein M911_07270 [Ectothiorhodospira haloalkaliphila]|uniref:Uncharacterized protein n=1 Tax=Ectothiorhodospira haloalkaliphila TaxID=421628 RepID=W8KII8_9GAMM|nr:MULTISPECIES: hypothetical protein [Ectothiorhodospira]AHK78988.1 hypothetical protein M911_07270 [Ectothiorhodospira haloalkaliphila]MCG5493735.1 hypothetical protein [Ectothiorhodospira variabilis]MCG5497826.1 hypothetical protein [Ectothiorhodospira variabilis]MCG5503934.1 hypothetical protein [Ectothiorhodospira variabilis]MCG5507089.1 hypothetical protein [Ectothiorhodospira variabilis]